MKFLQLILACTATMLVLSACCLFAEPQKPNTLVIITDHEDGLYNSEKDESICFLLKSTLALKPGESITAELDQNGKITSNIPIENNQVKVPSTPGWSLLRVFKVNTNGKRSGQLAMRGALTDVDNITAGAPEPADFDAFWKKQIDNMNSVPMNTKLTEVKFTDSKFAGKIRAWNFVLDCGNGNFAHGYISMPANAKPGTLPAIAQFHGAGTFGIPAPSTYYAFHSIHVVLSPHASECGKDGKYYAEFRKQMQGYPHRDADNAEKYYMKGMILRVVRTLQFIESRPEWDGKTLITHGESQGGFQAIVGAALDKHVSFCLAMVPAMSDHLGYLKGHKNGWPQVIKMDTKSGKPQNSDFNKKAISTLPYFDNANFAKRILCETWISTGLRDTTCPPSGVVAVYNNLPNNIEKHLFISPTAGHDAGYAGVVDRLHSIVKPE